MVANDFSKDAYTSMCKNIEYNSVGDKVLPSWREARWGVYVLLPSKYLCCTLLVYIYI